MKTLRLFACLFACANISAQSVLFEWVKSPDADVVKYRLFWGGSSGNYTNSIDVGDVSTATFSPVPPGTRLFFAVCAINSDSIESEKSNEVEVYNPGSIPIAPSGFGPSIEVQTSQDGKTWTAAGAVVMNSTNAFAFYRLLAKHPPVEPRSSISAAGMAPKPLKSPFTSRQMKRTVKPPLP